MRTCKECGQLFAFSESDTCISCTSNVRDKEKKVREALDGIKSRISYIDSIAKSTASNKLKKIIDSISADELL